jgi:hypothetical protein
MFIITLPNDLAVGAVFTTYETAVAAAERLGLTKYEIVEEHPKEPSTNAYRRSELENVDANGEYPAKLKITSDDGETKWLDITSTEFEQIRNVLLDYRNE